MSKRPNAKMPKCPQADMPICPNLCGQMGILALFWIQVRITYVQMPKRPNAQMPTSQYAHMPKFMWANGHFSIILDSSTNHLCPNAQTSKCPNAHKLICPYAQIYVGKWAF